MQPLVVLANEHEVPDDQDCLFRTFTQVLGLPVAQLRELVAKGAGKLEGVELAQYSIAVYPDVQHSQQVRLSMT